MRHNSRGTKQEDDRVGWIDKWSLVFSTSEWILCVGHPLDWMHTKSPLSPSIILVVLSWSDAIWRLYLSSLTLFLCPVKFLTSLSPLPLSLTPSQSLCLNSAHFSFASLAQTLRYTYRQCPACPPATALSGPDLCVSVWVLPVGTPYLPLPPTLMSASLFLFLTCLSSVQSALLGLRSIQ